MEGIPCVRDVSFRPRGAVHTSSPSHVPFLEQIGLSFDVLRGGSGPCPFFILPIVAQAQLFVLFVPCDQHTITVSRKAIVRPLPLRG